MLAGRGGDAVILAAARIRKLHVITALRKEDGHESGHSQKAAAAGVAIVAFVLAGITALIIRAEERRLRKNS